MKNATLVLGVLLLTVGGLNAAPLVPGHVPSNAKWVMHVDLEQMRSSKLAKAVQEEMEKHNRFNRGIEEVTEKLGMNPMTDLLGATVYDTEFGSRKGVVLVHCNKFDRKKLVALIKQHANEETSKYGGWTIYTWEGNRGRYGVKSMVGTVVNDKTIAISGDMKKLTNALDVISGAGESTTSDSKLLSGLPTEAILAARVVDVDPDYMKRTRCPVLKNCTEATVVWNENKGKLAARYHFTTKSAETAQRFKSIVDGLQGMVKLRFRSDKHVTNLLSGLTVKAKGTAFSLTYQAESDDIIEAAMKMKDMGMRKWGGRRPEKKDRDKGAEKIEEI